ncbi:hypothetical protein ACP70R_002405 [Stipagrostis hirtigluma subsp. patula]
MEQASKFHRCWRGRICGARKTLASRDLLRSTGRTPHIQAGHEC